MLIHRKYFLIALGLALALLPTATNAQILSDGDFLAGNYTSTFPTVSQGNPYTGLGDIRYNIDYSDIDIFGDNFVVASLPEAPNSDPNDTATTGVFLSANNDAVAQGGSGAFYGVAIVPNGLNVGTGTANPNYKMSVDVFHSSGTDLLDPNGVGDGETGTTNYSWLGLNQFNTTAQIEDLNAPGGGNLAGQGLGLLITGDSGAGEDYMPVYGGATYTDRPDGFNEAFGEAYRGVPTSASDPSFSDFGRSGLASQILHQYWLDQGLGFVTDDSDASNYDPNTVLRLSDFSGDSLDFMPDPANLAGYDITDPNAPRKFVYAEPLVETTGVPTHLSGDVFADGSTLESMDTAFQDGIVSNRWATHDLYWIDGTFTYVVDGVPVLEITPDHDPNDITAGNVYDDFSDAGSVLLGFFDRFSSIAAEPEGGNFVVYDNLVVEAATSGDAPDLLEFFDGLGFLLPSDDNADFDGDGVVTGLDFLILQQNLGLTGQVDNSNGDANGDGVVGAADLAIYETQYGTSPVTATVAAVPEPMSVSLLLLACGCVSFHRRRKIAV